MWSTRKFMSHRELRQLGFNVVGSDVRVSREINGHLLSGDLGDGCRIDDFCILTGEIFLAARTHISPFVFLSGVGGKIELGEGVGIGSHSSLFTKSEVYGSGRSGPSESRTAGSITVGTDSILGRSVTVLPSVRIGVNCVIGTGCVVSENIEDGTYLVSAGSRTIIVG